MTSIKLTIASSEVILSWSYGEVYDRNLFNAENNKPIINGLFCPRIFGPIRPYECLCKIPTLNKALCCKICGVDLNISKNKARSMFGHIQLSIPIVHIWLYRSSPNVLSTLLNKSVKYVQSLIDCESHIVVKTLTNNFKIGQVISTEVYNKIWNKKHIYEVLSGGAAILKLLSEVQLEQLKKLILAKCKTLKSEENLNELNNKLDIINSFVNNNDNNISSKIIINFLPVLPAALRPTIMLSDSVYASSDLNKLYKHIISINNNIKLKLEMLRNGKKVEFLSYIDSLRKLQYAVNELIDNTSDIDKSMGYNVTALRSLSNLLKGKKGRFRYDILGKRVDYSGRSVIAPGPDLLFNECAIPYIIALKLFKPFIQAKLMLKFEIKTIKATESVITDNSNIERSMLEEVVKYCPVILNRAPSLHKLSMRAFWVKLTNEKVIRLHPLTCSGFNADFDGDQMAVHIPLSLKARIETILLIISTWNVFHPAHGDPCILPTQDMIMGLYYMSLKSSEYKDICFNTYSEVSNALVFGKITLHTKIKFCLNRNKSCITITSTPGRLLIMEAVPLECNFIYKWSDPAFSKEYVFDIIKFVYNICGSCVMIRFNETLMRLGFKYASKSGLSISILDIKISKWKQRLLSNAHININKLSLNSTRSLEFWRDIASEINNNIDLTAPYYNANQTPIQIMFNSGARGTLSQIKQLIGIKGDIVKFNGQPCKMPILRSYKDGLSLIQFFYSTYSSRKSLIDTVLKTSDSGYLTRKLIEASREWIITELDCNTTTGLRIKPILNNSFIKNRLIGRILIKPIVYCGRIIININNLITENNINIILKYCGKYIYIRSPLTCQAGGGICKFCYGINLNTNKLTRLGNSVGVLAAQAIGEPGTQLTLRTFHKSDFIENENKIKDDWNIKDYLISPFSGITKITKLSCVRLISGGIVISNTNCVLSIYQDNSIIWTCLLHRGIYLLITDGSYINANEIIGLNIFINNFLSLTYGHTYFENLIYHVNTSKLLNKLINTTNCNINTCYFKKNNVPLLYLKVGTIKLFCSVDIYKDSRLLITSNVKINVFNILSESLKVNKMSIDALPFSIGSFTKLSRFFENSSYENESPIVAHYNSILKHGNMNNKSCTYVIDPISKYNPPIVYSICNNNYWFNNNMQIAKGKIIIPGDMKLSNYANLYGFNKFLNYFINTIQEIYEAQGVNVNSKHIEIILRQMTNIATILKSNDTTIVSGEEYEWQCINKLNNYISLLHKNVISFTKRIIGINDIYLNHTTLLSAISFQGTIKFIIEALITGNMYKLDNIKDHIILGKLIPIGTGFNSLNWK